MKRFLKVAGALVGVLLLALIALPFLIDANQFRPMLESKLSAALGREVKVGNLKLALLQGGVTADDLSIADDPAFSHNAFVQAKSFHVGVDLKTLMFSRKLAVTGLTIDQPQISLLQSASGEWNFAKMGSKGEGKPAPPPEAPGGAGKLDLSVKLVKISDGRFIMGYAGSRRRPLILEKVNLELSDFSPDTSFPFSLSTVVAGGGSIKLEGKAGPIDQSDVSMTPATLALKIDQLDLAGTGLNQIAPSFAGLVSFDGTGQSTGTTVDIKGKVKVEKVRLSAKGTPAKRVLALDFGVTHDVKKRAGKVHQADIHIGAALVSITGTYTQQGESMAVNMNLSGPSMPVGELTELLPALDVVLPMGSSLQGGTAGIKASIQGPVDKLVTTGSVSLNNTKLAGFNLPSKVSTIERLAGIKGGPDTEIQVLSSNVRVAPDGMSADEMKLVLPAIGDLEGAGTVSPDNAINFKMRASVHTSGIAGVINNTPVPFTVDGTCAQPAFHPDIKAVVKEELKGLKTDMGKTAGDLIRGFLGGKK